MPFRRNKSFVGRESEIAELGEKLASDDDCRRVSLHGLGGIGKTQIALEYAYLLKGRNPRCAIFWLPATSRESLEQAYMQIGHLLQIHGIGEENVNISQLINKRLNEQSSDPWLLIVDNADLTSSDMLHDLPSNSRGSIIFTTRSRKNAIRYAGINVIDVRQLDQQGARRVLETSLLRRVPPSEAAAVAKLLALLVNLPLAIVQAAAFINENDITISQYLSLYEDGEDDMIQVLSEEFEHPGQYRNIENPVATTWLISFESIRANDKLAADYLSFMACIFQEDIPESLLPLGSSYSTTNAIGTLMAYSFIQRRGGGETEARFYHMHRLVHLAIRGWLKGNEQLSRWTEEALMRLITLIPRGGHEGREIWTAYIPHAIYVSTSADISSDNEQHRIDLLDRIGCCQTSIGQYSVAEETHRRVLELREKNLGKEHPETLASMNNLAQAFCNQGKYIEAETMHREALALKEKLLGKEHPETLTSMNNLGIVLSNQGKLAEAERLHQETLALSEKVLGKEHPHTLLIMSNLANVLGIQGGHDETERMRKKVLVLQEKVLGQEHPDTLSSMANLASIYRNQGRWKEAEDLGVQVIETRKRVLGQDHPDTLKSMANLALTYRNQGRLNETEKLQMQVMEINKRVCGDKHPATLTSISNLAFTLKSQGRDDEAASLSGN